MEKIENKTEKELAYHVTATEHKLCDYCGYPTQKKSIIPCTKCRLNICHACTTFINDKPFCNVCVVDFVRNESIIIITKSKR